MKRYKRKLAKRVLAGRLTVDEARAKVGRKTARKKARKKGPKIDTRVVRPLPGVTPEQLGKAQALHAQGGLDLTPKWYRKMVTKSATATSSGPVLVKSESVPFATRDITTRDGVLEKDLVNAIRMPIQVLAEQASRPVQSGNPLAPNYAAPARSVSKAQTFTVRNPLANSDDPADREVSARLACKSESDRAREDAQRDQILKSMLNSDDPAEREQAARMLNPRDPFRPIVITENGNGEVFRDGKPAYDSSGRPAGEDRPSLSAEFIGGSTGSAITGQGRFGPSFWSGRGANTHMSGI